MSNMCAMNDQNIDAFINCYIGKLCGVNKFDIQPRIKDYDPYFKGSKYVAFDLLAFCDYQSKPRFGHVQQYFSQLDGIKTLYNVVTGVEYQHKNCDFVLFKKEVETDWFLFNAQKKEVLPEAENNTDNEYCNVRKKLAPPSSGNWDCPVAVPVFLSEIDAAKYWFSTDRVRRSKLVIIKADTVADSYICYDGKKPNLVKRVKLGELKQDQDYYMFDNFPYVLLQRKHYDGLCRELDFLGVFEKRCKAKGFSFDQKDLWNFHTSVKSGYLTVLSGMSGTGKSSILDMYAKLFGENCKLAFIPVSPSWTSDADLLGWYDPQINKYHCSTKLVDVLKEAAKEENKNCLYLICLDEMNLARVEHYFSQFLSVLERPAGPERHITLYHVNGTGDPEYPPCIKIGDNVRFVGTINVDDTTYMFADKVRDRSNIINLTVTDYSGASFLIANTKEKGENSNPDSNFYFGDFVKTYNDLAQKQEETLLTCLWTLHRLMNEQVATVGVSPRTVRAIGTYLANYAENDRQNINMEALDFMINQRVFTKIHGSEKLLMPLLSKLAEKMRSGKDEFSFLKDLVICKKTIAEKENELKIYGYCP